VSEEIQLRVHGGAFRLWTVPTDDGRTLLASSHKGSAVRVWDPCAGERVVGPEDEPGSTRRRDASMRGRTSLTQPATSASSCSTGRRAGTWTDSRYGSAACARPGSCS
jgi:hypothetical protein